jgi:PAS domain S-box-containing protein
MARESARGFDTAGGGEGALRLDDEEHFRALADNAAEAIVTADADDRIVYANPAAERIFGYAPGELLGRPFTGLMPARFRDEHRARVQRHLAAGERRVPWTGAELAGLHRGGAEIPLEATFGAFVQQGRHLFTGIMRDVTERRRIEAEREALLARERAARAEAEWRAQAEEALGRVARALGASLELREAMRLITEGAVETTRAFGSYVERFDAPEPGSEIEVVAAVGRGIPPIGTRVPYPGSLSEEIVEKGDPKLISEVGAIGERMAPYLMKSCPQCTGLLVPLLSGREVLGALVLLRGPDQGRFGPDEVGRARILGDLASAALRRVLLLASERQARTEAEARRGEIARVMESRSRLMRGFSHDVKNPLGAADGYAALLEEGIHGPLTDEQRKVIGRVRRSIRNALDLIEDMHEFARAEAGHLELQRAAADLRVLVCELVEDYRASATASGLTLQAELPPHVPKIETDGTRVRQVLGNLLSNAVKYTEQGGVTVRLATRDRGPAGDAAGGASWIAIEVEDTGPGIPADEQPRLFREFSRLHTGDLPGAGLGLAISQRLAHALGGSITVESEAGQGARFTLWLPRS